MYQSVILLLLFKVSICDGGQSDDNFHHQGFSIGAIVDYDSRLGKEEMTAMGIAIEDYYRTTGHKPVLDIRDSGKGPLGTTYAAMDLINKQKVGVLLDFRKLEEVAIIGELGNTAQVPILSYAEPTSLQPTAKWPFLIQAAHNNYKQMKVAAAIIRTWQWQKVNLIYEDVSSARLAIVPLIDSLKEVGTQISHFMALRPSDGLLSEQLKQLKDDQCRVFIIHTSLPLANNLFKEAKKMGLMEKDSVWIITNGIIDHLDFANASVISTMQGILGVGTYFTQNGARFENFKKIFRVTFPLKYPQEEKTEPGISALKAYDAIWIVALAMEGKQKGETTGKSDYQERSVSPLYGQLLLKKILQSKFVGLAGETNFEHGELAPSNNFHIINVVGKSYRELGYWSEGKGFSKSLKGAYNTSMKILGQLIWPGDSRSTPRGWTVPTSENPLTIGVPGNDISDQFAGVIYDPEGNPIVSGFAINVFKAMLGHLPYNLPHNFVPYNGTYNDLIKQVFDKKFDAAVGDIAIVAPRNKLVEFSTPWSDSGIQMVVFRKSVQPTQAWLFFKPFTPGMWGLTAGITIYNGFIIWFMERMHHPELNGSVSNNIGVLIWIAFTTLFSLHGERLHTNLSRMAMVVWLFVAIIIIQSYTASLTSMLTIPYINLKDTTVDFLKMSNAKVGCDGRSFVVDYLERVLEFKKENIKGYYSKNDYPQALEKGEIAAVFLEVPYVKLFMAKNCKNFVVVGETFKVGGFGFAFPKGSPMLPDITQAILEVEEKGELRDLENALLKSYNCSDSNSDIISLSVASFWGLFMITGGTSTISFIFYFLGVSKSSRGSTKVILPYERHEHHPSFDELNMFAPEMAKWL